MSDLWGFQAGQSIRHREDMAQQLNDLALREGEQKLQEGELTLQTSNMALQAQKRMLEFLDHRHDQTADAKDGAPKLGGRAETTTLPDTLDELSMMALASGMPTQAADYAAKSSTIRSQASEIATRETQRRLKNIQLASNLLGNVTDQKSWNQANMLYATETGEASPFAGHQYSPQLVEQIQGSLQTAKDQALTMAAKARAKASEAATKEREARIPLIKAQTALTQTRDQNLRKAGATGAMPKAEDLRAVTDLMNTEYAYSVTPEEMRTLARPVAERTAQLMRDNMLTRSQAASRAFQEAQAAGDFGGLRRSTKMPGSRMRPLDMPESKDKLKPNMFYQGKGKYAGQTLLWNGKTFVLAPTGAAAAAASSVTDDEEADDNADATTGDEEDQPVDAQGNPVYDNEHTDVREE